MPQLVSDIDIGDNRVPPRFAARLRTGRPAVLPRVKDGAAWFDLRTVHPEQDEELMGAIRAALVSGSAEG